MSMDSFDPQKFKGLNNSQVYASALIIDVGTYIGSLMWLVNQSLEDKKFYIFLGVTSLFCVVIIPIVLYKFLFGVEKEITKRKEIDKSEENGIAFANEQIDKFKKLLKAKK